MSCRVLIVEDEIFVATDIEWLTEEMGYTPVGIAADKRSALRHAQSTDVALVDLNLRDGATGVGIGRVLAQEYGVTVLYLTANPAQLGDGVEGTLGVLSKPASEADLRKAIAFAVDAHNARQAEPPKCMRLFNPPAAEMRAI